MNISHCNISFLRRSKRNMPNNRFELKFSRVIPSLQFCRPNERSLRNSIHRLPSVNLKSFPIPSPPPSTPVFPVDNRHSSEISTSFQSCTISSPAKSTEKHNTVTKPNDDLIFKPSPMLKPSKNHVLLSPIRFKDRKENSCNKVTPSGSLLKTGESFVAVEKSSKEPFEDFKRSMMEMIVEKEMFEMKDLEELLHCFLSLNSRHYHGVIIMAFSEIWDVLCSVSNSGR